MKNFGPGPPLGSGTLGAKIYMSCFNNMGVDLGYFWGEEFESDKIFMIQPKLYRYLTQGVPKINDFKIYFILVVMSKYGAKNSKSRTIQNVLT